ncbi:RNase adapter RapZ [Paracoccus marinaquae]|uniref:RNase adapter RapZ n=1 Tax=Paracoccus marinaquae TaxID=2841926 RepID=A0ABS6AIG6_9RHOB|nr:RNase adapter RapZ [Paracoccus marinaquae]MBU3030390.1 RNase adapter RapZ [Paracoccus marinaquae]
MAEDLDSRAEVIGAQRLVLVTGPSGAGRSTAINVLEDLGFEAIDNLPLSLIPRLLDGPPRPVPLALGLDVRNRDFSSSNVIELIDKLTRSPDYVPEVLFLDCAEDVLVRRYSETRRRHPLAPDASPLSGVMTEMDLLTPIRDRADVLVDTTELTPHDLKAELTRWFQIRPDSRLSVSLHSFSYRRGVPRGVDMMFDCRWLANPHWEPALRQMDGRDAPVQDYVARDPRFAEFFARTRDLILFLLPAHIAEGKTHVSVGFGCTGGQHRSVTLVEKMALALADAGWPVSIRHRELERRMPAPLSFGGLRADDTRRALDDRQGDGGVKASGLGEMR